MYYLLLYQTIPDYLERRTPHRADHFAHASKAVESGNLLLGGAFADPAGGAALVFQTDDPEVVTDFAENDPYVRNGLIESYEIREWTVVLGSKF